jgi:virulence-associated protein VagC
MAIEAKIFRNGANQAVRIPVELSFDTDTVIVEPVTDGILLRPKRRGGWQTFFDNSELVLPEEFETPEDLPLQER